MWREKRYFYRYTEIADSTLYKMGRQMHGSVCAFSQIAPTTSGTWIPLLSRGRNKNHRPFTSKYQIRKTLKTT